MIQGTTSTSSFPPSAGRPAPRAFVGRLLLRILLASLWAAMLTLGGLWVMLEWPIRFPAYRPACLVGGFTAIIAGQFVFCALVADRLYPRANPWVSWSIQGLTGFGFIFGIVSLSLLLLGVFR